MQRPRCRFPRVTQHPAKHRGGAECRLVIISLPESLKTCVDQQVRSRAYSSSSEYVRELIRKDQDRQRLRGLLLDGVASPPAVTTDADYFGRLRDLDQRDTSGVDDPVPTSAP